MLSFGPNPLDRKLGGEQKNFLKFEAHGSKAGFKAFLKRGLNNHQYCFGVPYFIYSTIYTKTFNSGPYVTCHDSGTHRNPTPLNKSFRG